MFESAKDVTSRNFHGSVCVMQAMTRSFFLFLALGVASVAVAADTKEVRRTVSLNPKGRVVVDTYKGTVRVTTWDQPQVEIHVRIESDGWGSNDRELFEGTEIEIDSSADSLRLKTRYPKAASWSFMGGGSQPLARYTLRIPRTADLRIKDYKSEIEVEGLTAALDIDTYKGDVRVRRQDGPLTVKTYKSEARVDFARYSARSSFETYRGTYDISLPRDSRFEIQSDVGRHGSLNTSFQMMMPAGSSTGRNFRASINGGGPVMNLKAYRGEFNIR
jgi:hypothetical protein